MEKILQKLIETPTITKDKKANADLIHCICQYLSWRGMHTKQINSNGYISLIATTQPNTKHAKVMLAAHTDVIAAPPEMFKLQKHDGKYYGRGVYDMKFAIANFMQLVDDIKDNITDYDFCIVITSDEEFAGENGTLKVLDEDYSSDVCILPDGGANWQMERLAKGVDWFQIDTIGQTAHASTPWLGKSASANMLRVLSDIQALFLNQGPDNNTLNIGTIYSGTATNQVAESATVTLDVRTISPKDQKIMRQQIADICGKHSAIVKRLFENGDVVVTDQNDPRVIKFKESVKKIIGKEPGTKIAYGSSDARYFAARNQLCIVMAPPAGGHHSDNEWLEIAGFYQYKEVLRNYLDEVARQDFGD